MTLEELQTHIVWLGDRSFYHGEAVGHRNENDEEDVEAEDEEGTSEGSKTTSDNDEEMRGK